MRPPVVRRQIKIVGADKVADAAALVGFVDASPEAFKFLAKLIGFVEQDSCAWKEIEDGAVGSGHGGVKLPAGKDCDPASAYRGFYNFFRAGRAGADDAFAGKPGVNCAQQLFVHGSFGERQEQDFVHRSGGALRSGIELADGIDFVAEELDAHRTVGFGRVDVEDAAAQRVLAGHFDHIGGFVADGVEVSQQGVNVEGLAATDGAAEIGIVVRRTQADGCGGNRGDHDGRRAGCDLPQCGGAFFLQLRMRRQVLERQHVACGQRDDRLGIAGAGEFAKPRRTGMKSSTARLSLVMKINGRSPER